MFVVDARIKGSRERARYGVEWREEGQGIRTPAPTEAGGLVLDWPRETRDGASFYSAFQPGGGGGGGPSGLEQSF